ncbi:putative glycosyl hydrolase [Trichoderma reesei RUT C-30]|uniref:Mannan endo-1,6-alpha-mannosidase n=1 Tax=Hypocrea jecorina (strain ATCC 56765 / BCRC 32924 / NRRL 11460 / Rut C-30) TaxID=1344414 RepID=A0A024S1U2_HYPJR|nr:putative glycosyl hydrolase [Trichoderma reesei RUT C-30]
MRSFVRPGALAALVAAADVAVAQQSPFSIASTSDIKKTAATVAWDMLQYYHGNESGQTPGILPGPPPAGDYYWWEGGAMWGTLIDYWYLTGDTTYNDLTMQAIQFQTGPDDDFQPPNVTLSLGNDDQGFWGMTAMLAAEEKFPDPPADKPQWLALAQGVFNTQASPERHDDTCGGGLRWQIPPTNPGYSYKNSIANGCFFNLGARLARYTGNTTYSDWAEKTWDWMISVGFLNKDNYAIYDGADVSNNCTQINKAEFSYNNAVWTLGAAYMYNHTGSDTWKNRLEKLVDHGLETFFPDGIAYEPSCEGVGTCTTDMVSFKGYIHRWYSTMTQLAPFMAPKVLPVLKTSTEAAIKQCTGGALGRQCGFKWNTGKYDGRTGAGQEMNVVGAVSSLLIGDAAVPVTGDSGGTSKGNPNAGSKPNSFQRPETPVTAGDKAGAGIVTIIIIGSLCTALTWMSIGA